MKINKLAFQPLIDEKFISVQKHPTDDLYIYNYTQKCQFAKNWTPETLMSRGLITKGDGTIVARPFDKFFNLEEATEIPTGPFSAWNKFDGSLGILYRDSKANLCIATRGSFTSEQAIRGTKMLREAQKHCENQLFFSQYTYLFEIIYPENRIVVDYGGKSQLVFLGARDIETGMVFTPQMFSDIGEYFPTSYPIRDWKTPRFNAEGVVLYYDNGDMYKAKYEEYVRLHRLVTGVNAKTIWEMLRDGKSMDELLERVPDEFFKWVCDTTFELTLKYKGIETFCKTRVAEVKDLASRKLQAEVILHDGSFSGVIFAMLDKKPYNQIIWKMVRPKADRPFKEEI